MNGWTTLAVTWNGTGNSLDDPFAATISEMFVATKAAPIMHREVVMLPIIIAYYASSIISPTVVGVAVGIAKCDNIRMVRACILSLSFVAALVTADVAFAVGVNSSNVGRRGPATDESEFFATRLDTSVQALADVRSFSVSGDLASAEKAFAAFVRRTLDPASALAQWKGKAYSASEKAELESSARKVMDYVLTVKGREYRYPSGGIDWFANRSPDNYCDWLLFLHRLPFFSTLAEYYVLTGDERAAKVFVEMMESWMTQSVMPRNADPWHGEPCWRGLETATRLGVLNQALHAFVRSPELSDKFVSRLFVSLDEHGRRLLDCVDGPRRLHGNWLSAACIRSIVFGLHCPFLRDAAKLREAGERRFVEMLDAEVYPDGFEYELSPMYHMTVANHVTELMELYARFRIAPPERIAKTLENMVEAMLRMSEPDGSVPPLGDSLRFQRGSFRRSADFFPRRADFRFWLSGGSEGTPPGFLSNVLPYAGFAVFRSSWSRDAVYACFDVGPVGRDHGHEDKLSLVLSAYGRRMIVDGGQYRYDGSPMRKYIVSTRAHNTAIVDGLGQNRNPRRARLTMEKGISGKADFSFSVGDSCDVAESSYSDGYGPSLSPFIHTRKVAFFHREGRPSFFVVIDRLAAEDEAEHAYELPWHLEDCSLAVAQRSFEADFGDGTGLLAFSSDGSAAFTDMKGTVDPEIQGWVGSTSPNPKSLSRKVPTPVLKGRFLRSRRIVTILWPHRGGICPVAAVESSPDVSDTAFAIVTKGGKRKAFFEPQFNQQEKKGIPK